MWETKARNALVETFMKALEEEKIPWRKCWNAAPLSFSTGKPYRGINNLMLSYVADEKGYKDTRWMTYKYAQDHGWQVRKGEKSVRVEYWTYYDTQLKKKLDQAEVARIQREEPDRLKDIRLATYTYNVFNVEQIDGDIPPLKQEESRINVEQLTAQRDRFLAYLGVAFREGGDRAFYSLGLDEIHMPYADTFTSDYAYICTLLHEAGHATGHPCRLNRNTLANGWGSLEYAKEELRAEIASAFTAQALNIPLTEAEVDIQLQNHTAYLQSWIEVLAKDPNELFAAIKDADKIADYLLDNGRLLELAREAQAYGNVVAPAEELEDDYELEP